MVTYSKMRFASGSQIRYKMWYFTTAAAAIDIQLFLQSVLCSVKQRRTAAPEPTRCQTFANVPVAVEHFLLEHNMPTSPAWLCECNSTVCWPAVYGSAGIKWLEPFWLKQSPTLSLQDQSPPFTVWSHPFSTISKQTAHDFNLLTNSSLVSIIIC